MRFPAVIDETELKVGDVVQWSPDGPERTVLAVEPWKHPTNDPDFAKCKAMGTFTSAFTKSGTVQCSLWEGNEMVLLKREVP